VKKRVDTEMVAQKKASEQSDIRIAILSEYGEIPEYNVDEYADRLTAAKRKFDRLCQFALDEHEAVLFETDDDPINWGLEIEKRAKALKRWQREIVGVLRELVKVLHEVRRDEALLVFFDEETSDNPCRSAKG
jgi:predicted nucleotidyltransferase